MTPEIESLIVTEEDAEDRLDVYLAKKFAGRFSRTYFQGLVEQGCVLLNGEAVKKRVKPQPGDEIEVELVLTPEVDLQPEPIPLDILFEDQDIIAINKPAGMVVHPAVGNWTGTFVNALLHHCKLIAPVGSPLRPGIVHRLDKDTTGVLIAAKTANAHQALVSAFSSRDIHKEYLAICLGNPGKVTIDAPIGRHAFNRKMMSISELGKSAISHVETLAFNQSLALVRVILETGRTHQIRVHLKHHRTPVLGDATYGNEQNNIKWGANRQLLHAHKLRLKHPITGMMLEIVAPIPSDMTAFIQKITGKIPQ